MAAVAAVGPSGPAAVERQAVVVGRLVAVSPRVAVGRPVAVLEVVEERPVAVPVVLGSVVDS